MDAAALIKAVQCRPAIWDNTNMYYKNKLLVKQLWNEIAQDLNCDADLLKTKWKNLRDYYRNELKKIKIRTEAQGDLTRSTASVWPYMESMSFIRHLVNTRPQRAESKINFIKCEPNDDADEVEFENECAEEYDSANVEDCETVDNTTQCPVPLMDPPPLVHSSSSRLYNLLESGTKRSASPVETSDGDMVMVKKRRLSLLEKTYKESEDSDLLFLKSLLPDIKSLPRTRRTQLRLKFQQLVCEAVEETEADGFNKMTHSYSDS